MSKEFYWKFKILNTEVKTRDYFLLLIGTRMLGLTNTSQNPNQEVLFFYKFYLGLSLALKEWAIDLKW